MTNSRPLRNISPKEFDLWQPALKVISHEHARRFAAILLEESSQEVALSWRSEVVKPVVLLGNQSELWLGVDQRIACVDSEGKIVVSIGLASSLLDIRYLHDCVAVLCETEVMLFNPDHSIRKIHGLHDIPVDITECDGILVVNLEDGMQEIVG